MPAISPARSAAAASRPRSSTRPGSAATGRPKLIRYGITDEMAWDVGLACGGTIEVFVEPVESDRMSQQMRNLGSTCSGSQVGCRFMCRRRSSRSFEGKALGAKLLVPPSAVQGTLGTHELDAWPRSPWLRETTLAHSGTRPKPKRSSSSSSLSIAAACC